ncbi:hypothetical protein B0H19DRAFT_153489 [Mycena capillaripes]|nr:hypothetical protein B0H19DRAFT_153489 [Mycena capillaripes]
MPKCDEILQPFKASNEPGLFMVLGIYGALLLGSTYAIINTPALTPPFFTRFIPFNSLYYSTRPTICTVPIPASVALALIGPPSNQVCGTHFFASRSPLTKSSLLLDGSRIFASPRLAHSPLPRVSCPAPARYQHLDMYTCIESSHPDTNSEFASCRVPCPDTLPRAVVSYGRQQGSCLGIR